MEKYFYLYPEEIAESICDYIGENGGETVGDVAEALNTLKAICENKYNSDYYRTFYKVLDKLAGALGVAVPF